MMRSYGQTPYDDQIQIMQSTWKKRNENAIFNTEYRTFTFRKNYQDMQIYSLEPGKYTLQSIEMLGGGAFGMALGSKQFRAGNLHGMVNFTVNSGDVIYIGDIFLDTRNSYNIARSIKIEDHFNIAKENINKIYPEFEPRLKKKLMRVSSEVSLIQNLDKNTIDGAIEEIK